MAGINWGMAAGGAQDAMQQMLEQRILEEKMALAQRQQQAEEQYRAAQLAEQAAGRMQQGGQFDKRLGFDTLVHEDGAPGRAADVAGKLIENTGKMGDIADKGLLRVRRDAARPGLEQDNTWAPTLRLMDAGVNLSAVDPNDPTGSVNQQREIDKITAHGDQSVRTARVSAANSPRYTQTKDGVDQDGKPVSLGLTRDGRWEPINTPDGTTIRTPAGKVTGMQSAAARYFHRGATALQDVESMEGKISGLMAQVGNIYAPNLMKPQEQQIYTAAQRQFTEARLRKDSGAAIPPTEFENDAKMYFVQPGDSPEVIAQKGRARRAALAGLVSEAKGGLDDLYGEEVADQVRQQYRPTGAPGSPSGQAPAAGPEVGKRGTINGRPVEWDGKGWKAVRP